MIYQKQLGRGAEKGQLDRNQQESRRIRHAEQKFRTEIRKCREDFGTPEDVR